MKEFIITVISIIIAAFLVTTFMIKDTGSMKSETDRIGNVMVTDFGKVTP